MSVSFEDTKQETIGNVLKPSVVEDTTVDVAENIQPVNVQTDKLLSKQTDVDDALPEARDTRIEEAYERAASELAEQNVITIEDETARPYSSHPTIKPPTRAETKREKAKLSTEKLEELREEIYYMATEDSNVVRRKITNAMLDKGYDLNTISWTVFGVEVAPITGAITAVTEVPETAKLIREAYRMGDGKSVGLLLGVQALDVGAGIFGLKAASKGARKVFGVSSINRVKNKDKISLIRRMEEEKKQAALKAARELAQKNSKLKQDLIDEFELNTGKEISDKKTNKKGVVT